MGASLTTFSSAEIPAAPGRGAASIFPPPRWRLAYISAVPRRLHGSVCSIISLFHRCCRLHAPPLLAARSLLYPLYHPLTKNHNPQFTTIFATVLAFFSTTLPFLFLVVLLQLYCLCALKIHSTAAPIKPCMHVAENPYVGRIPLSRMHNGSWPHRWNMHNEAGPIAGSRPQRCRGGCSLPLQSRKPPLRQHCTGQQLAASFSTR